MSRLNKSENFSGRVAYAAATIAAGRPTSRAFDNCFENSDGDEVATFVYRRSIRNPKIAANIWRYLDRKTVTEAAARLSHVATRDMPKVAAESRAHAARVRATARATPFGAVARPGNEAAVMHEETGIDYETCLIMCNMD